MSGVPPPSGIFGNGGVVLGFADPAARFSGGLPCPARGVQSKKAHWGKLGFVLAVFVGFVLAASLLPPETLGGSLVGVGVATSATAVVSKHAQSRVPGVRERERERIRGW